MLKGCPVPRCKFPLFRSDLGESGRAASDAVYDRISSIRRWHEATTVFLWKLKEYTAFQPHFSSRISFFLFLPPSFCLFTNSDCYSFTMRVLIVYLLFITFSHGSLTNVPLDLSSCRTATGDSKPCCLYPTDWSECVKTVGILCSDLPGNPNLCKPTEAMIFPTGNIGGGQILSTVCKSSVEASVVPPVTVTWDLYTFRHVWQCCPCPSGYTLFSSEPTDCNDISHNPVQCLGCNGKSEIFSLASGTPTCLPCSAVLPTPASCSGNAYS